MTMGEYIKQLRIENGWSQEQLGKKVGVNRAAVNKWEQGTVENIKRSTIKKLSEIFDVSPCDLMCWDDKSQKKAIQKETQVCEIFEQCYGKESFIAVQKFLRLDSSDKKVVVTMIDSLLTAEKYSVREELRNA